MLRPLVAHRPRIALPAPHPLVAHRPGRAIGDRPSRRRRARCAWSTTRPPRGSRLSSRLPHSDRAHALGLRRRTDRGR
jgi:hypothetical protein